MIFRLRFGLDLFAGIRPVRTLPGVPSPLVNREGIDHVVVRENVEGLYASVGKGGTNVRGEVATDTIVITRVGTQKVVRQPSTWPAAREEPRASRQGHLRRQGERAVQLRLLP